MYHFDLIQKCLDVIDSCETPKQLQSAITYTQLTLLHINRNANILDKYEFITEVSKFLNDSYYRKVKALRLLPKNIVPLTSTEIQV